MTLGDPQDSLLREKERRNSPRMAIKQLVYVTIAPGSGGLLVDLGEEGMCISIDNPLALSTEFHFSFTLDGHRIVQGMGRVCWRWQPDKKVGVQFIGLASDLHSFIRKWLGIGNEPSSLMFLPGSSKPMQHLYGPELQPANEDRGKGIDVLRSAITSRPSPTNDRSQLKGILLATAVCVVLFALGVVIYPGRLPRLTWLNPVAGTEPASKPGQGIGLNGFTEGINRLKTPISHGPPGQPIRNTKMLYSPDQNETRFPVEVTDASRERWLATVTNQNLTVSKTSDPIEERRSPSPADARNPAPSMSPPGLSLRFKGLMKGVLRSDGALVVEGARPSSPSNPTNRRSAPQPVVVEAMVGSDGAVRNVQLISSADSSLAAAVVATVRQWRYWPLYENGQAIEFATRITFDFSGSGPQAPN